MGSRSRSPISGDQISRLGAHFDPIRRLRPRCGGSGRIRRCCSSRRRRASRRRARRLPAGAEAPRSERAGLAFALVYLLYPPVQWLVVTDFHPVAFATPLLLWGSGSSTSIALGLRRVAVAACTTKEHIGFVVAAIGAWYALARRRRPGRRRRAWPRLVGVLRPGSSCRTSRRAEARRSPAGTPPSAARRRASSKTLSPSPERSSPRSRQRAGRPLRVARWPLGGLSLLGARHRADALPELAANLLSSTDADVDPLPYTAGAIPGLIVEAPCSARLGSCDGGLPRGAA